MKQEREIPYCGITSSANIKIIMINKIRRRKKEVKICPSDVIVQMRYKNEKLHDQRQT